MPSDKPHSNKSSPRLWLIYALLAVIFVPLFVTRYFLYDFYSVPAGSMSPTINVGDMVVVNKYIFNDAASEDGRKPERGEIIAFHPPHTPETTYLKRVIGIPGDVIQFSDKQLTINGKPIETLTVDGINFSETLNSTTYTVQYSNEQNPLRNFSGTVSSNHYFVMGDNRDNSLDSREWGFVSTESLVGKVVSIW
ncbi:signal peptidase I [Cellvibrio sp.]|uniref:signal peptidase I n=1 Tax=Cellvibrio sp. TaxID=1965322 RepID=UPI003F4B953E